VVSAANRIGRGPNTATDAVPMPSACSPHPALRTTLRDFLGEETLGIRNQECSRMGFSVRSRMDVITPTAVRARGHEFWFTGGRTLSMLRNKGKGLTLYWGELRYFAAPQGCREVQNGETAA
jgi:hypothetical protein